MDASLPLFRGIVQELIHHVPTTPLGDRINGLIFQLGGSWSNLLSNWQHSSKLCQKLSSSKLSLKLTGQRYLPRPLLRPQ